MGMPSRHGPGTVMDWVAFWICCCSVGFSFGGCASNPSLDQNVTKVSWCVFSSRRVVEFSIKSSIMLRSLPIS
jgi:hypothetical protein